MKDFQRLTFSRFILAACLFLTVVSCKKDNKEYYPELVFPSDTYYVPEGKDMRLYIQQGNMAYDVLATDADLLEIGKDEQSWPAGAITLKGLKKGSTTLTVRDRENNKTVELTVHVVDPYLILKIGRAVPLVKFKENVTVDDDKLTEIRGEIAKFNVFDPQNILILKSAAVSEYLLFKDQDQIELSQTLEEGLFELKLSGEGAPTLKLAVSQTSQPKNLSLFFHDNAVPNILTYFFDFPTTFHRELRASAGGVKVSTSVLPPPSRNFLIFQNITEQIKTKYDEIDVAELYQEVEILEDYQNYGIKIGTGVLTR